MWLSGDVTDSSEFADWYKDYKGLLSSKDISNVSKGDIRDVIDTLENSLTPENMKCEKVTPKTIDMGSQHEVWFEGKYIMIPKPKLAEFINAVHGLTK
jgi:hypothetical protein